MYIKIDNSTARQKLRVRRTSHKKKNSLPTEHNLLAAATLFAITQAVGGVGSPLLDQSPCLSPCTSIDYHKSALRRARRELQRLSPAPPKYGPNKWAVAPFAITPAVGGVRRPLLDLSHPVSPCASATRVLGATTSIQRAYNIRAK